MLNPEQVCRKSGFGCILLSDQQIQQTLFLSHITTTYLDSSTSFKMANYSDTAGIKRQLTIKIGVVKRYVLLRLSLASLTMWFGLTNCAMEYHPTYSCLLECKIGQRRIILPHRSVGTRISNCSLHQLRSRRSRCSTTTVCPSGYAQNGTRLQKEIRPSRR